MGGKKPPLHVFLPWIYGVPVDVDPLNPGSWKPSRRTQPYHLWRRPIARPPLGVDGGRKGWHCPQRRGIYLKHGDWSNKLWDAMGIWYGSGQEKRYVSLKYSHVKWRKWCSIRHLGAAHWLIDLQIQVTSVTRGAPLITSVRAEPAQLSGPGDNKVGMRTFSSDYPTWQWEVQPFSLENYFINRSSPLSSNQTEANR